MTRRERPAGLGTGGTDNLYVPGRPPSSLDPNGTTRRLVGEFHDSEIALLAAIAAAVDAAMALPAIESLRAEALRRGVSVYRVRVDRAAAQGRSRAQAAGRPRAGEPLVSKVAAPRTPAALRNANPAELNLRERQLAALDDLRRGRAATVGEAERLRHLPRGSLRRDAPTAFDRSGAVKAADQERSLMRVLGPSGDELVVVGSSRQRRMVGQHRHAVGQYLRGQITEDDLRRRFLGKKVAGIELEVDGDRLRALQGLGRIARGGPYPEAGRR